MTGAVGVAIGACTVRGIGVAGGVGVVGFCDTFVGPTGVELLGSFGAWRLSELVSSLARVSEFSATAGATFVVLALATSS